MSHDEASFLFAEPRCGRGFRAITECYLFLNSCNQNWNQIKKHNNGFSLKKKIQHSEPNIQIFKHYQDSKYIKDCRGVLEA